MLREEQVLLAEPGTEPDLAKAGAKARPPERAERASML
jgi:hypothetical protein